MIFSSFIIKIMSLVSMLSAQEMISGFDHELHLKKVFSVNKVDCTHCHNFSLNESKSEVTLNESAKESIFKLSFKQICHECHRSELPQYQKAPKACFNCHKNIEAIKKIKPQNHEAIMWKNTHSAEARIEGDNCLNCHMTAQCSKCHLQRNDVKYNNHPQNFRFYHSVQARAQPQRCDACHTKTFCTTCHLGKK